nr:uncharacterized protein LOC119165179 [Rhipicephalus microplus]
MGVQILGTEPHCKSSLDRRTPTPRAGHTEDLTKGYNRTDARKDTNSNEGWDALQERASSRDQFFVELHIISDRKHQYSYKSNEELITYMAVMTNAANLRYLDMAHPKIKYQVYSCGRDKGEM